MGPPRRRGVLCVGRGLWDAKVEDAREQRGALTGALKERVGPPGEMAICRVNNAAVRVELGVSLEGHGGRLQHNAGSPDDLGRLVAVSKVAGPR